MIETMDLVDPVARCKSLLASTEKRILIGMAGLPGSGKSTLAKQIEADVNSFAGEKVMVQLSMDGFHLKRSHLLAMPNGVEVLKRRGAPWTFDSTGFYQRLMAIKAGLNKCNVPWPEFEHGKGDPVEGALVIDQDVRLVLVEGLYVFYDRNGWEKIPSAFDEKWFLNTPLELSLDRLANRHMKARNISRENADIRIAENDRLNADIALSTRTNADFLVASRATIV